MRKNKWFALLAILLLLAFLTSCGSGGTGIAGGGAVSSSDQTQPLEPVVLKFSDVNGENSPAGIFCNTFKTLVEERTQGRVKIELYFGGTLTGNDIESTQTGIADISQHDVSEITDLCKLLSILEAPYLYDNDEQLFQITTPGSEIMEVINEELSGSGVQLLATYSWGNQQILTNKPIYRAEDLKGLKIRVLPSAIFMTSMKSMGATPTPMSWSEVIPSLVTNMIDGTGLPFTYIVDTGMQEIVKYVIMTDHNPTLSGVFINETSWNKISGEDKGILQQAGVEARQAVQKEINSTNAEKREVMVKAGMTIIEKEQLEFDWAAIRDDVFREFEGDWGENYQRILTILGK